MSSYVLVWHSKWDPIYVGFFSARGRRPNYGEVELNCYLAMFRIMDKNEMYSDLDSDPLHEDLTRQWDLRDRARKGDARAALDLIQTRCYYEYEQVDVRLVMSWTDILDIKDSTPID